MTTTQSGDPPAVADLLITGADLVTMDAARPLVRDGAIAVRAGEISWIGPAGEARRVEAARTLDGSGQIALPGLIDTHFHTGQQLLRGKIIELAKRRQLRLPIWRNYLIPFESVLTEEDLYLSAQLAYANALRVGTTCFAEAGGPHPDQMARAALDTGIRGLVALSTMDTGDGLPSSMRFSTREAIDRNVALVKAWGTSATRSRVGAWLALRQLLVCSRDLWEAFRDAAGDLGTRIHIHLAEGTYEVEYAAEQWGMRPAEYLDALGFLGPAVHAAHSILLSAGEIDLYADHQVSAAHCPLGNFIIGVPKIPEMRRRGIRVGLGTDGAASGSIDLFEAIRVSWVALQSHYGTPWHVRNVAPLEDLLRMATLGGAEALGLDGETGSLEPGKKADIVLASTRALDLQPVYDPVFTAARGITGRDVESVIVDGEVVVEHGALTTLDETELRARLAERWPVIMERFESATGA
ncbi:MAG TPA: amidohydrolase [Streptosporangiaceae bacterium]|nr:amidohydrolase [Streptosporangiaceae bacterium]